MLTVLEAKRIAEDFALGMTHNDPCTHIIYIVDQEHSVTCTGALNDHPTITTSIRLIATSDNFTIQMSNLRGKSCNVSVKVQREENLNHMVLNSHLTEAKAKFYRKIQKAFELI